VALSADRRGGGAGVRCVIPKIRSGLSKIRFVISKMRCWIPESHFNPWDRRSSTNSKVSNFIQDNIE